MLAHERVPAILDGGRLVLCHDYDGVLVYQLAGGVGESRQGQGDPLHLTLVHSLLVLLLQVPTPKHKCTTESQYAVANLEFVLKSLNLQ